MKLFLLYVVFIGLAIFEVSGMGKTIVVSKRRARFDSIQKAIDYASSGDSIKISPGRYIGRSR